MSTLVVRDVKKTFYVGFFRKRVEAVRSVSFAVQQGETFGLLGPNGAGKTTTIKMLLGLISKDAGELSLFGKPVGPDTLARVGYAPESPYVYPYLRAPEFLDLCGRVMGMDGKRRAARVEEMIALFDLTRAVDRPVGRFSKGMMQRLGLAQALLHDPELLVLDEPMSGLDPVGRKQVRDIILNERRAGKTLLFTSHVLSDVEMLCDRIAIVQRGEVVSCGTLDTLLRKEVRRVRVQLSDVSPALRAYLAGLSAVLREHDGQVHVTIEGDHGVRPLLEAALREGATVVEVEPERETLEDLFVRRAVAELPATP